MRLFTGPPISDDFRDSFSDVFGASGFFGSGGMNITIIIGVCAGGLAFLILFVAITAVVCRNKKSKLPKSDFQTQVRNALPVFTIEVMHKLIDLTKSTFLLS